jgi:hypothetical protein
MSRRISMSTQTRKNWLIDAVLFVAALVAALSGIYFLFVPSGGYQGGRNPLYEVTILFSRDYWDDLHTWGGVLMIATVAVHLAIPSHLKWIKMTSKRIVNAVRSRDVTIPQGVKINIITNIVIAVSFLLTAVSGVYFLLAPAGGFQGGSNSGWDPGFLLSRTTWDLIHTWSGAILVIAAVIHFAIHWRWVENITKRFFLSLRGRNERQGAPATH